MNEVTVLRREPLVLRVFVGRVFFDVEREEAEKLRDALTLMLKFGPPAPRKKARAK